MVNVKESNRLFLIFKIGMVFVICFLEIRILYLVYDWVRGIWKLYFKMKMLIDF